MASNAETDSLLQIDNGGSQSVDIHSPKQTSISRRRIILALILMACVIYALFEYWLGHRTRDYGDADTDALRFEPEQQDTARKYRATQFVSFTINTMGGAAEFGECKHRHVDPELGTCYLGDYNITNDVHQRVAVLERVLKRLKKDTNGTRIDNDPSTLKIMMVPEVSSSLLALHSLAQLLTVSCTLAVLYARPSRGVCYDANHRLT